MSRISKTFPKMAQWTLVIVAILMFSAAGYISYQYYGVPRCTACGMVITSDMKEHFRISDAQGNILYACCQACMLRLLDDTGGYEQVHIQTYCDWYGPGYKIIIDAKEHGNVVTVTPETTQVLLGALVVGSCASSRIAYNPTAADMLLLDGYSQYAMTHQRCPMPEGTPIMSVLMAAKVMREIGITYAPPRPWLIVSLATLGTVVLIGCIAARCLDRLREQRTEKPSQC